MPEVFISLLTKMKCIVFLYIIAVIVLICISFRIPIDELLINQILSLKLDSYPIVNIKKQNDFSSYKYRYVPTNNKLYYRGYVKRNGTLKYFRFVDFRQEGLELQYPLNKFIVLFEKLEQYPFSLELENCK